MSLHLATIMLFPPNTLTRLHEYVYAHRSAAIFFRSRVD